MKNLILNHKGLTFVEVLVSFALVAMVIISLVAAVMQSMVFSKRIDTVYTASYLAQRRVDMLKRFAFDELYPGGLETNIRFNAEGNMAPNGHYMRTTEIDEDYNGNIYLKKVKITVSRVKINMDGSIIDPVTGDINFMPNPTIVETLFSDVE